ncbi:MAG: hypothetical protein F4Y44_03685 [Chloroflexi bacterium]|nr:hypothetical protein [Chloroflexota bacterium]
MINQTAFQNEDNYGGKKQLIGSAILGISTALVVIPLALLFVISLPFGSTPTFIQQVIAVPLILGAVGLGDGMAVAKGN